MPYEKDCRTCACSESSYDDGRGCYYWCHILSKNCWRESEDPQIMTIIASVCPFFVADEVPIYAD